MHLVCCLAHTQLITALTMSLAAPLFLSVLLSLLLTLFGGRSISFDIVVTH